MLTTVDAQPHLSDVRITPGAVQESQPPVPTGMVTLSAPAQSGGCQVRLTSDRPSAIDVPPTVTIPEGAVVGFFVVNTTGAPAAAVITASVGDDEDKWATVSVLPTVGVSSGRKSAAVAIEQPANTITPNGSATVAAPPAPAAPAGGAVQPVLLTPADRIAQIRARMALARLDAAGQAELARLARAVDELAQQCMFELIGDVDIATSLLLADPPQVIAAAGIRKNVEKGLGPYTAIAFLRRNSSIGNVSLGLGALVVVASAVVALLVGSGLKPGVMIAGLDATLLVLVGLAGALGSVISVMYRINNFNDQSANGPLLLFFTGLFKPVIGVGFAWFAFVALSAKLTTLVQPSPDAVPYFYAALGFLAGFVEKFAPDLIDTVGKAIDGSADSTTQPAVKVGA
jgi:hypothetical protein